MRPRSTFRRKVCLGLLSDSPLILAEVRWRTWLAEWQSRRTTYVCAKSAYYRRSIERSISLWEDQGYLSTFELNHPISYGLAAKLAVFTALERGQLSSPAPAKRIRLYFSGPWCSIIVIGQQDLAVNLGAVFIGDQSRYRLVSTSRDDRKNPLLSLSEVPWDILNAEDAKTINPSQEIPREYDTSDRRYKWQSSSGELETSAPEGVAISLLHSTPGRLGPYILTGEQIRTGRQNSQSLKVPPMRAH